MPLGRCGGAGTLPASVPYCHMDFSLSIESILERNVDDSNASRSIGRSREGRPILGFRRGSGPLSITLIGGCHADEPVGPATLRRLVTELAQAPADDPRITKATWTIVPHAHPDGAMRNRAWSEITAPTLDSDGRSDIGYCLKSYVEHVARDLPGEDIEFGFPRDANDQDTRPENRALASFLRDAAPIHLHGSFHGMSLAPGPWFLIERSWADRTVALRDRLRELVARRGFEPYDIDRAGEKGFWRIDRGFTSRPDSVAMSEHFAALGDQETAALFRPSSMEYVRSLGGDPFTFVTEMPLFLRPNENDPLLANLGGTLSGTEGRLRLQRWLQQSARDLDREEMATRSAELGIRPMPIRDQAHFQLAFLEEAIQAVLGRA